MSWWIFIQIPFGILFLSFLLFCFFVFVGGLGGKDERER